MHPSPHLLTAGGLLALSGPASAMTGSTPPWKPVAVYDDGRRVYVEFPSSIVQGEMPPIFVIGS